MSERIMLTVPAIPKYVSTIRLAVSSAASQAGLDIEAIEDMRVAVSEACNNAVQHAEIDDGSYQVVCDVSDDRIDITVSDEGTGYDTNSGPGSPGDESAENTMRDPGSSDESGLGLGILIIRTLMDEVDVQSKPGMGTIIRMTKYIPADR